MSEDIQKCVQHTLQTIATEKQVRILYACESGSRAWGFASANSDYDVRFLYIHPYDTYLQLDQPRDVIECPVVDELDISGWDIFKALRLLRKSNPPLLEWLYSPVVYLEQSPAIKTLRELVKELYSPAAMFYHYRHMASGNYRQYIQGKDEVLVKKYLYVLRPIVALLYLEQHQEVPPTDFVMTLNCVDMSEDAEKHIYRLIIQKRRGEELGMGKPSALLNELIENHLNRWETIKPETHKSQQFTQRLNEVLHGILEEKL